MAVSAIPDFAVCVERTEWQVSGGNGSEPDDWDGRYLLVLVKDWHRIFAAFRKARVSALYAHDCRALLTPCQKQRHVLQVLRFAHSPLVLD